ncbi:MAG: TIGR01906 family membrane protein [Chloroflexi bacterium]|nr:TIGR01906 family membrane protein [Chloroflexota bacterium]|tara:strand:- start:3069 stop:3749 length:681 start_codon:yes stop_codon:yes gene_type:complete
MIQKLRLIPVFLAIPIFLVTTNAFIIINSDFLYEYGFKKYSIDEYTGIEMDQLYLASDQIRDYFNNDEEYIVIEIEVYGETISNLYNDREILHMKDVKHLLEIVWYAQIVSLLILVFYSILSLYLYPKEKGLKLGRDFSIGAIFTLSLIFFIGIIAIFGFDKLFLYFHLISFTNDLWILDPRYDYLIMMFPQGFFFDSTIVIAILTILECVLISIIPTLSKKLMSK